jgi:hypothetical protein
MSELKMGLLHTPMEMGEEIRGMAFATQGGQDEVEGQGAEDEAPISLDGAYHGAQQGC